MNDYVRHREFLSIYFAKVSMIRISFIGTHSEILKHNVTWTCSTIGSGKVGSWSRIPTHFHGNPASRNSIFAIPTFYLHYPELISSLSRTSIFAISNFFLRHPELQFLLSRISFFHNTASVFEIWGISLLSSQVTYLLNVSHIPEVYFCQIPNPGNHTVTWICSTVGSGKGGPDPAHSHSFPRDSRIPNFHLCYRSRILHNSAPVAKM